ncbi:2105_t:CDS:10 [Ambispora gerdemannii]|uniref:2105_t:CDS:1 n=1 Tax=Ambispora gerdemannii TaxID=144530 RepID=A0A9N9BR63_9GLOM|nr:2105_t:CDS:10 [Ambispora gerdemannii]
MDQLYDLIRLSNHLDISFLIALHSQGRSVITVKDAYSRTTQVIGRISLGIVCKLPKNILPLNVNHSLNTNSLDHFGCLLSNLRMLLQQTCPGKINCAIQSLNIGLWNDVRYILYGTWDKLVIHNGCFEHVQTIGLCEFFGKLHSPGENQIVSVELSEHDGKIAVTYECSVIILEPYAINKDAQTLWKLLTILKYNVPVLCTAWSANNEYLWVGGGNLSLWKYRTNPDNTDIVDWSKIWEQIVASNITLAKLSPDCRLLAVVGQYDRNVKIWWRIDDIDVGVPEYDFNYLAHPQTVTNFAWRKSSSDQANSILLTMCRDGICRIWAATNPEEPQFLYICTVIDPSQFLVATTDENDDALINDSSKFTPIHYIQSDEFVSAVNLAYDALDLDVEAGDNYARRQLKRLKELIVDKSDLLYQVQRDGSMIVWAIQHLSSRPRRVPRVLVLMRMEQALLPLDAPYFDGTTTTFYDHLGSKTRSSIIPAELSIVAQGPHGRINCYSISLTDFFDNTRLTTRLYLKNSWTGHHCNIESIVKAPGINNIVSVSNNGEVVVWAIDIPQFGLRVNRGIVEKSSVCLGSVIKLVCLLPGGDFLAAYDQREIVLFSTNNPDGRSHEISHFENYDPAYELCLLFSFPQHSNTFPKSNVSYVAGVSMKQNSVFCWKVIHNDQALKTHFISRVSLPTTCDISMAVSVGQWAGAYSSCHTRSRDSNPPVLLTFSDDGCLTYWRFNFAADHVASNNNDNDTESSKDIWSVSLQVTIDQKRLALIKCGPNDRVALVNESRNEMSIWESITPRIAAIKEYVIESSDPIVDVDWLFTTNAELVVAVATAQKIAIYTQLRKYDVSVRSLGILISQIDIPPMLPDSITAISWSSSGSLVVSTGNQLRCYNKWLSEASFQQVSRITGVNDRFPTLFHIVDHFNGPLPHHHPTLLLQYLLWGKMDLVKQILAYLYNYLKIIKDADQQVTQILPVPFDKLFDYEPEPISSTSQKARYSLLFDSDSEEGSSLDDSLEFTDKAAEFLSEQLTRISLPDLSNIEQAQLLALVHTIVQVESQKRSLDENGVRYVIFMRRYHYLQRATMPGALRASGLSYRDMIWALHSESQNLLVEYSISASGGSFLWKDAKVHGIILWLSNIDTVRQQMEIIARNQYMAKEDRDPTDAALFYMALRKKKLLLALWRTANHLKEQAKIMQFLANDFEEPRWKTAALKNAYVLLGKQRYEYAASFFLLGDCLKDAVNVCLKHLDDFQLAVAICRVYEGDDGPVLKSVIQEHIIPLAIRTEDRWLAHMAFWMMNQRDLALQATMMPLEQLYEKELKQESTITYSPETQDAALIVLYKQLKEKSIQTLRGAAQISAETEYSLVLRTIFAYERMGCPLLALHVLKTWIFTFEPASRTSTTIFHHRKRTTVIDVPLPSDDDPISKGVVSFDEWGWDMPAAASTATTSINKDRDENIFEFFPTIDQSKTADIFASQSNGWSWKRTRSNPMDIFTDESSLNILTENTRLSTMTLLDDKDLSIYKFTLQVLDGVSIVSQYSSLFSKSLLYRDYLDRLYQGLKTIYSYALSFRLLNAEVISEKNTEQIVETLINDSYALASLTFSRLQIAIQGHLCKWARETLLSFNEWLPYARIKTEHATLPPDIRIQKITLSAFVTLCLLSVRQQQYDQAWACLLNCAKFFHASLRASIDLSEVVGDVLHEVKQPDTSYDVISENDVLFDNSEQGHGWGFDDIVYGEVNKLNDPELVARILEIATINHLIYALEIFLHNCQPPTSDDLEPFVTTAYLEPMLDMSTRMEREILQSLPQLTQDNVTILFKEPKHKQFWGSLICINEPSILLPSFSTSSSTAAASISTSELSSKIMVTTLSRRLKFGSLYIWPQQPKPPPPLSLWHTKTNPNPFDIFDLPHTACAADIKKRYYDLVKEYHPDQSRDTSAVVLERFRKVVAAYEILGNPRKKDLYLRYGFGWEEQQNNSSSANFYNNNNHSKFHNKNWHDKDRYHGAFNNNEPIFMANSYLAAFIITTALFGGMIQLLRLESSSMSLRAAADRHHLQASKDLKSARREGQVYGKRRKAEIMLMAHYLNGWQADGNVCKSANISAADGLD